MGEYADLYIEEGFEDEMDELHGHVHDRIPPTTEELKKQWLKTQKKKEHKMTQYDNTNKGAMWLRTGPKGKFMAGTLNVEGVEYDITMNKNTSDNPKAPQYRVSLKAKEPVKAPQEKQDDYKDTYDNDDEVPF